MANVIDFKSDNLIELLGPVDRTTGLPVDEGTTTVTVLLFDANKDTYVTELDFTLAADADAGETVLSVTNNDGVAGGDLVRIDVDEGYQFATSVASAVENPPTITMDDPIPFGGVSKGNLIHRYQISTINFQFSMNDTTGWRIGDRCAISLDLTSTSFHIDRVSQVRDSSLQLDSQPATPCSVGNSVACSIETGSNITLSAFGDFPITVATTVEGDPAWGYRGTLPSTSFDIDTGEVGNLGLQLGQRVRFEYTMTLVGGQIMFRTANATVVNL